MKNIFNSICFKKICVVFAPSPPNPTVFFASFQEISDLCLQMSLALTMAGSPTPS